MGSCWKSYLQLLKQEQDFSGEDAARLYYEKVEPTSKRLISLIDASTTDDAEKEALGYFKRHIRGLDSTLLKILLRFLTGSDLLIVDYLAISFVKFDSEFSRCPIAHSCTPCLELPSCYKNLSELREEFTNILARS